MTPDIRASTIARVNPVAKLAVALILSAVLLLSIDVVSASVALLLECVLLFWSGISARQFWIR
ncbi:MAG TPA: energy-coupling factor transporter transmembrane protein EcfT, partial [Terrimesophilobacter sp.]|nr:energy-coupling factor transporter transmembrane protein EcfT [Terrimesophilobacter sp.]